MSKDSDRLIAFQGIAGAHSDVACRRAHPYMDTLPCPSFEDVFDAVEQGRASLGFIPIENSQAGRVAEIHNLLPDTSLSITGEYLHRVEQHLLALKGAELKDIKTVYSHPQALMQCRKSLRKLSFKAEPLSDTALAAKAVSEWKDATKAALASDLAAELYALEIVQRNMEDSDSNHTLFITLSKEPADTDPAKGAVLTSLIFTVRNIPAGLYKALGGFATNGVNLLKIESYILGNHGTAQFFVTFEGHPEQKHTQRALEELGFFTKKIKFLGVYYAGEFRSQ